MPRALPKNRPDARAGQEKSGPGLGQVLNILAATLSPRPSSVGADAPHRDILTREQGPHYPCPHVSWEQAAEVTRSSSWNLWKMEKSGDPSAAQRAACASVTARLSRQLLPREAWYPLSSFPDPRRCPGYQKVQKKEERRDKKISLILD